MDALAAASNPPASNGRCESEAFEALCELARGKSGKLPPAFLARQALAVTSGGDFAVQRAALEALLRRSASARSEKLRISARPAGPLGR
ncbi:MAG: hypothetical protein ACYDCL_02100 [Myxococcales bacterium]